MRSMAPSPLLMCVLFFFNDTATTEIYTLSLHDALPIYLGWEALLAIALPCARRDLPIGEFASELRSEEHTSELQSLAYLVCRLLLEKKKNSGQLSRLSAYTGWARTPCTVRPPHTPSRSL